MGRGGRRRRRGHKQSGILGILGSCEARNRGMFVDRFEADPLGEVSLCGETTGLSSRSEQKVDQTDRKSVV